LQYMVILFCLFFVQLSIAAACLAVNKDQQKEFAREVNNLTPVFGSLSQTLLMKYFFL